MTIDSERLNAWQLMLLVHRELNRVLAGELQGQLDLPLRFFEVLFYISNAGDAGLQIGQLAQSLSLEPSSTTRFVDRMEQAGLVRRRQGTIDRRANYVVLTARGGQRFSEAASLYAALVDEHFGRHLTLDETHNLNRSLDRVLAAIRS